MAKSAYDKLSDRYPGLVKFGNPVPSGKRPESVGVTEITDTVDAMTAAMPEGTSTTAMRCEALEKVFLSHGDTVWIKTATGMGRARFWARKS